MRPFEIIRYLAVPVHCKTYDGNVTDDQVHIETWSFLRELVGHADFLYVADCKLCTRDNMSHIASRQGRFLTVLPRTRAEDSCFRDSLRGHPPMWHEVCREPNPRRRDGPDVVYDGVESRQRSAEATGCCGTVARRSVTRTVPSGRRG
jgi:hypothetical protein